VRRGPNHGQPRAVLGDSCEGKFLSDVYSWGFLPCCMGNTANRTKRMAAVRERQISCSRVDSLLKE
jgi:hypothetical protein